MSQIKSGIKGGDGNDAEWSLHVLPDAPEVRTQRYFVQFEPHFKVKPSVIAALTHVDVNGLTGCRLNVTVEQLTASGFELVFTTWDRTQIYGAHASWLAFGD